MERTNCFHCRAPKNPSTSKPVKDSKLVKEAGAMGMAAQVEELTKQVALIGKKQDDDNDLKYKEENC